MRHACRTRVAPTPSTKALITQRDAAFPKGKTVSHSFAQHAKGRTTVG
jgi:hypothetical protein